MVTGVFFSRVFSGKEWPIIGDKFGGFPEAMSDALALPNVKLFEPEPVPEELLVMVHEKIVLDSLRGKWYREGALLSSGGTVNAAEKCWLGEISNALVFSVAAGHHAGPRSAWGGTYVSCIGPAIVNLRRKHGVRRFSILYTDAHHGDGCRAIFSGDRDVLHVCFCGMNSISSDGTKIDVSLGWETSEEEYLEKVNEVFVKSVKKFKPSMIFHFFGHDTCQGDYGDIGLTRNFYVELAKVVFECSEEICDGKYIVVTGGGSRGDIAEYVFPKVVKVLAGRL